MAVEVEAQSPAGRPPSIPWSSNPKKNRSRVTNGKELLPGVDGRSPIAKRFRDIASAILIDQGGVDRCSESRKQLIRRFAAAAVLAEQVEAKLANGEDIDIQQHATLSSTLVRLAQRIGIERVAKDVELNLGDFMRMASMIPATGSAGAFDDDKAGMWRPAPKSHPASPQRPLRCLLGTVKYECTARRALYAVPK